MFVIHFVMSVVHLCNYCVTLYYSTAKMGFAQYCIDGKRKGAPGLKGFTVFGGESGQKGGREEGAIGYKGSCLTVYSRTATASSETFQEHTT